MTTLQSLYQEIILDHYRAVANRRRIEDTSLRAEGINPTCGDELELFAKITDGRVIDVAYYGEGCSICCASANMLCEALQGRTIDEAHRIVGDYRAMLVEGAEPNFTDDLADLEAMQGVKDYPIRIQCALLAWSAMQDLLRSIGSL